MTPALWIFIETRFADKTIKVFKSKTGIVNHTTQRLQLVDDKEIKPLIGQNPFVRAFDLYNKKHKDSQIEVFSKDRNLITKIGLGENK